MRRLIAVMGILLLLLVPAGAVETEVWDSVDTEGLQRQADDYIDIELTPDIDLDTGLSALGATALEQPDSILVRATRSGGLILMIALFCCNRFGWGWDRFVLEANSGKGRKVRQWRKPLFRYAVPAVILFLYIYGLVTFKWK